MRSPFGALFSASFWRFSDTVYLLSRISGKVVILMGFETATGSFIRDLSTLKNPDPEK